MRRKKPIERSPPTTVEDAVVSIIIGLSEEDVKFIKRSKPWEIHFTVGRQIRNNWDLWKKDGPLKMDAINNYGIAHPDDISGLIIDWVYAMIQGYWFDPQKTCERFHNHWNELGITSLQAGGIDEK